MLPYIYSFSVHLMIIITGLLSAIIILDIQHTRTHELSCVYTLLNYVYTVIASFDGYVSYHTTLQDFVMQCDDALNSLYYEEAQADFETMNSPTT